MQNQILILASNILLPFQVITHSFVQNSPPSPLLQYVYTYENDATKERGDMFDE